MSYRDDHDAALARIDALQDEIRRLRARPAPVVLPQPPKRRRRRTWLIVCASLLAVAGLVLATYAATLPPESVVPVERALLDPPVVLSSDAPSGIASCRAVLQAPQGWRDDAHGAREQTVAEWRATR